MITFAYDQNGEKIRQPSFSGQRAECPICKGTLIGKCGEINVWHWAHEDGTECDTWKEFQNKQTKWHLDWKAKFPLDWQEVRVEEDGKIHIADIKTSSGLVIEFQNSSISTFTIRERENFYKNMIWVVNAKNFNITKKSEVKSSLRNVDDKTSYYLDELQDYYAKEVEQIENELNINKWEIDEMTSLIADKIKTLFRLKKTNKEAYIADEIKRVENSSSLSSVFIENIKIKKQYLQTFENIKKLQNEIDSCEKELLEINKFKDFIIDNKTFKIVKYEQISPQNFHVARAISKENRNALFPEIKEFKTELNFRYFSAHKNKYDFFVDPTSKINFCKDGIEDRKKSIESIEHSQMMLKQSIANECERELKYKIEKIEKEIKNLNKERSELISKNKIREEQQANIYEIRDKNIREEKRKINENRFKIMREKKGLYRFIWKHERKSWKEASKKIYLDFEDDYLYELVGERQLKRIEVIPFLEQYLK